MAKGPNLNKEELLIMHGRQNEEIEILKEQIEAEKKKGDERDEKLREHISDILGSTELAYNSITTRTKVLSWPQIYSQLGKLTYQRDYLKMAEEFMFLTKAVQEQGENLTRHIRGKGEPEEKRDTEYGRCG